MNTCGGQRTTLWHWFFPSVFRKVFRVLSPGHQACRAKHFPFPSSSHLLGSSGFRRWKLRLKWKGRLEMFVYPHSRNGGKLSITARSWRSQLLSSGFRKGDGWENELFWLHQGMLAEVAKMPCVQMVRIWWKKTLFVSWCPGETLTGGIGLGRRL